MTAVRTRAVGIPWVDPDIAARDEERRAEKAQADTSFIDADWKTAKLRTLELYRTDPTCYHCGEQIHGPHYATALQYRESGDWKLFHELPWKCALDAIVAENRRRAEAAS
jgi:hypothetical protein